MEEREVLATIEDCLASLRRQLMTLALEDRGMREALWFVVRETSVITRELRQGRACDAELLQRMTEVLRITESLMLVVRSFALIARMGHTSTRPPWRRL